MYSLSRIAQPSGLPGFKGVTNFLAFEIQPSVELQLPPPLVAFEYSSNPLGEEQRHVGPLVALANTLANLSRLKVLDISHCCLIGLAGHRYHGLNAMGNAFSGAKNSLTHLRYSYVCLSIYIPYWRQSSSFAAKRQQNISELFFLCC